VRHDGAGRDVTTIRLADAALSVSGGASVGFADGDVERGHVLDPRDGVPLAVGRLAWVVAEQAADADALSTALLVAGRGLSSFRGQDGVSLARGGWLAHGEAPIQQWPASEALTASAP
jgi:thiamine biosynthesis lipoprotein ApbE